MAYTIENRDIVINGWKNGISDNPYDGVVPLEVNTAITFAGADLPNGLLENTPYYIKTINTNVITNVKTLDTNA